MSTEKKATRKAIKCKTWTGEELRTMREKRGLNQGEFWSPLGVTQSGASRYETGRRIPAPLQRLVTVTYGTRKQADTLVAALRGDEEQAA